MRTGLRRNDATEHILLQGSVQTVVCRLTVCVVPQYGKRKGKKRKRRTQNGSSRHAAAPGCSEVRSLKISVRGRRSSPSHDARAPRREMQAYRELQDAAARNWMGGNLGTC